MKAHDDMNTLEKIDYYMSECNMSEDEASWLVCFFDDMDME